MTEIPDDAMLVVTDKDSDNYVRFRGTDVIEWFTEYDDNGNVQKEQFVSTDPQYPQDIAELTDSDTITVGYHDVMIEH